MLKIFKQFDFDLNTFVYYKLNMSSTTLNRRTNGKIQSK
jgi:hypothetical protein